MSNSVKTRFDKIIQIPTTSSSPGTLFDTPCSLEFPPPTETQWGIQSEERQHTENSSFVEQNYGQTMEKQKIYRSPE